MPLICEKHSLSLSQPPSPLEWQWGGNEGRWAFIQWHIKEIILLWTWARADMCWDQHCTYLLQTYHICLTNRTLSTYEENCPDTSTVSVRSFRANFIRSVLGQIRTHFHMCAIQSYSAAGRKFNLISLQIRFLSSNKFNQKMKLGTVTDDFV